MQNTNSLYDAILQKALKMHLQTLYWTAGAVLVSQIIIYFVMSGADLLDIDRNGYLIKYLLFPSGCNFLAALTGYGVYRTEKLSLRDKIYLVSLLWVFMAFIICITHGQFDVVYILFVLAIFFTVFYGDKYLTTVIFLLSVTGRCISTLFCIDTSVTLDEIALMELCLALLILSCAYGISLLIIRLEMEKRELLLSSVRAWKIVKEESQRDSLTRLLNRRALEDFGKSGLFCESGKVPEYLAFWDIDDFKVLNDTYGHRQGDEALKYIGRICREEECGMTCFRYGGDEFCALIFDKDWNVAEEKLKNLQKNMEDYGKTADLPFSISISIGVVKYDPYTGLGAAISEADKMMYQVKKTKKGSLKLSEIYR